MIVLSSTRVAPAVPSAGADGCSPPTGTSGRGPGWVGRTLLALLVAGAGAVHALLTPEHFREGLHFGLFFLGASAFQVWLAGALLLRPRPLVYRAGLWGSGALVATWMATRLIAPPGAESPEPVDTWGVLATGLEIAAVVALASTLPSVGPRPEAARRRLLAAAAGIGFALLVLFASGAVTVIPPGRWTGPANLFRIYPVGHWRFDGLWIVVAGRWSALIPWLTVGFVAPAALLVAWTVSLGMRLPQVNRCSARRRGVLAALPACATVPVCCGAPFTAFAGTAAVGTLFQMTPWLMGASLVFLGTNAVLLRERVQSGSRGAEGDPDAARRIAVARPPEAAR